MKKLVAIVAAVVLTVSTGVVVFASSAKQESIAATKIVPSSSQESIPATELVPATSSVKLDEESVEYRESVDFSSTTDSVEAIRFTDINELTEDELAELEEQGVIFMTEITEGK